MSIQQIFLQDRFESQHFVRIEWQTAGYSDHRSNNELKLSGVQQLVNSLKYSGDLNTGLVWYSNGQKLSDR